MPKPRKLLFLFGNLLGIAAVWLFAEWYLGHKSLGAISHVGDIYQIDPELGLSAVPASAGRITFRSPKRTIFDHEIEYDSSGFRRVPPPATESDACVFLFGGSLALGLGLGQEEMLASQLQRTLRGRAKVFTFGFEGYGPHHVLRILELGRIKEAVKNCKVAKAYNLHIADQIKWASGKSPWLMGSPRYEIENGKIKYAGKFRDPFLALIGFPIRSRILARAADLWMGAGQPIAPAEADLYQAIMRETQRILREQYHSDFTNVLFSIGDPSVPEKFQRYEISGIPNIYFETLAQKYSAPNTLFRTYYSEDGHLNKKGSDLIAGELLALDIEPWLAKINKR